MASKDEIRQREQWIVEHLLRTGSITVEEICRQSGVSLATARRDLQSLGRAGRLRRTHGGAVSVEPLLYEHFQHALSYREQIEKHATEKRHIAIAATQLIADEDMIMLTAGTTTNQVARSIPAGRQVTIVTTAVNVAMELSNRPGVSVFVTGGFLHGEWFSLVGAEALQALSRIFANKVFVGVNGVHPEHGATGFDPAESAVNQTMVQQSREKIVVADHSKLGVVATHLICPVGDINILITDSGASQESVAGFVQKGIDVRRV